MCIPCSSVNVLVIVVCDIRILLSIRYWGKYRNFNTIFDNFNCVGGVIAWAADIYKYA